MRGTIGSNHYFKNKSLLPRRYCGGSDLRLGALLNLASYTHHVYPASSQELYIPFGAI
jgi:hypothetical protein